MRIKQAILALAAVTVLALAISPVAKAAESFTVADIRFVGIQRISEGTALNYLPVREGDTVTSDDVRSSIRALFRAGFFEDVQARRDGNTLIFVVKERPTIAEFDISGNKEIKTEQLEQIMRSQGLTPGRILDRSILDLMKTELIRQYHSRGRYNVIINFAVQELPNNLAEIDLIIREGETSRIKDINFVGNHAFDEDRLREEMELDSTNFWSWIASDDKYAREQLVGDLEAIESFYLNRGYADFRVDDVIVSLSPLKQNVYLTIKIEEGDVYTVEESKILGNLIVPVEELRRYIVLKPGETFSQAMAEASAQFMAQRLEAEGYAFAEINPVPQVDRETRKVTVVYQVDPGRRVGVRSVMFEGAPGTNDEVYRRQMRQFEGAWLSNARVERSKVRIERLPFVEKVETETVPVQGRDDLVDVKFNIKERSAGEFQVGVGYAGSATGIIGNASISHANFMGSGERIKMDLQSTSYQKVLSLSHSDPYSTINGITQNVSLFYSDQDSLARGFEDFASTSFGGGIDFIYPVSEFASIGWGVNVSKNEVSSQDSLISPVISIPVRDFLTDPAHGDVTILPLTPDLTFLKLEYTDFVLSLRAGYDSRNRSIFATRGSQRTIRTQVSGYPGDVQYYGITGEMRDFFGLGGGYTLTTLLDVGYIDTYGESSALPPSKRLFAGGFDTIRGFRQRYLGPIDRNVFDPDTGELVHRGTGTPVGGKLRTFLQTELLLPNFTADDPTTPAESAQFSLFVDAGNLYREPEDFDVSTWRVSAGVAATFLTPVGALRFSYGIPIETQPGDELERVQFTIGSVF
ncbi:MAG: outer membrane protein assembly factor BamA [Gammaproteobacteria bacterium]|nr:outer membrane protein assembly factor BamA [Gammaproteobacteria bacterium]